MPSDSKNGITIEAEALDSAVGVEGEVEGSPNILNDLGSWGDNVIIEWEFGDTGSVGDQIASQVEGIQEDLQPDGIRGRIASEVVSKHIPSAREIATVGANQLDGEEQRQFRWEANVPSQTRIVVPEEGAIHDNVSGVPVQLTSYLEGIVSESAGEGPTLNLTIPTEAFIEEVPLNTLLDGLEIGDISFPSSIDPTSPPTSLSVPVRNTGELDVIAEVEAFGYSADIPVPSETSRKANMGNLDLSPPSGGSLSEQVSVSVPGTDESIGETLTADWPEPPTPGPDLSLNALDIPTEPSRPGELLEVVVPVQNSGGSPADVTVEAFGEEKSRTVPAGSVERFTFSATPDSPGVFDFEPVVTSDSLDSPLTSPTTYDVPEKETPEPPEPPEFSLGRPQVPDFIPTPGSAADVTVPVENVGGSEGVAEVTMLGQTRDGSLAPGERETLSFSLTPDSPGDLTLEPELVNQATGESQSTSRTLTIPGGEEEDDGPKFTIAAVDAPLQVQTGERYEVGLTVKNTGDESGDVTVLIGDEDDPPGEHRSERYTLSPQGTATFTEEKRQKEDGTYTHTFTVTNESTGNSITRTVVVPVAKAPPPEPTEGTIAQDSFYLGNDFWASDIILRVKSAEVVDGKTVIETTVENDPLGDGFNSTVEVVADAGGETDSKVVEPYPGGQNIGVTLEVGEDSTAEVTMKQPLPGGWTMEEYFDGSQPSTSVEVPVTPPKPPLFEIINVTFPDVVDIGEKYVGKITLENVGEEAGEVVAEGPGLDETRTIGPGEESTFEPSLEHTEPGQRFLSYTFENVSEGNQLRTRRTVGTEVADLFLDRLIIPDSAKPDEVFAVEAVIGNRGGAEGPFQLAVGEETTQGLIPSGGEQAVSIERSLSGFSPLTLPIELRNRREGTVVDSRETTVEPDIPTFEIQSLDVPDAVPLGEDGTVGAVIENVGAAAGEYEVSFGGETETGTLSSGETGQVSFPVTAGSPSTQSFSLGLRNASLGEDVTSETVEVPTATPSFAIQNISAPDSLPFEEEGAVDVTVENAGTAPGEYALSLGGTERTGSLSAGETADVSFPIVADDVDEQAFTATLRNATLGRREERSSVDVTTAIPSFEVQSISPPDAVPFGEEGAVEATIENTGTATGGYRATFGDVERTGALSPGETAQVSFPITADTTSTQSVPFTLRNETLERGETSRTITVPTAVPSFSIESVDAPDSIVPGDQSMIGVNVSNTGNAAGEAVVSLAGQEERRTIQPDQTATINFQFQKGDSPVDVLTPSVSWEPVGQMDSVRARIESPRPDITLTNIDAPSEARRGEPFTVTATVENNSEGSTPLVMTAAGQTRAEMVAGNATETFRFELVKGPKATQNVPISVMVENAPEVSSNRTVTVSAVEEGPVAPPSQPPQPPTSPGDDNVPPFVEGFFDFVDELFGGGKN